MCIYNTRQTIGVQKKKENKYVSSEVPVGFIIADLK